MTRVSQSRVSECLRRVVEAVANAGARNKWVHFPKTTEEKAAVKERFLRRGSTPGIVGCVDGSLIAIIAPKGERKAAFMCRKGYYALNCMFTCDAEIRILAVEPVRPGADHDSAVIRRAVRARALRMGTLYVSWGRRFYVESIQAWRNSKAAVNFEVEAVS
ncbi:putative nuclease HARBI1 [Dermacentor albipictus]|uniref:putative nuclease HARBI1 n=1 Tax=Dermacentor albipictus TaxID=60249 RepID=UPI0038FCAA71